MTPSFPTCVARPVVNAQDSGIYVEIVVANPITANPINSFIKTFSFAGVLLTYLRLLRRSQDFFSCFESTGRAARSRPRNEKFRAGDSEVPWAKRGGRVDTGPDLVGERGRSVEERDDAHRFWAWRESSGREADGAPRKVLEMAAPEFQKSSKYI